MNMNRDSFLFYKSYYEMAVKLEGKETRCDFYEAIMRAALFGEKLEDTGNPVIDMAYVGLRPLIDANIRNYVNGCKGGAPAGTVNNPEGKNQYGGKQEDNLRKTNGKPKDNRRKTNGKGNVNDNDNVNVNDNDKDNVNDNVNVKDNISPLNPPAGDFIPDDEDDDENGKWMTGEELLAKYGSGSKKK